MRQFLAFASKNTIEDVQAFTAQWAPSPRWVRVERFEIHKRHLQDAAMHLQAQLGPDGIHAVGGKTWWQWRQGDNQLEAEWIEMRKDHDLRRRKESKCRRSMLYVHGGAYYFASVDSHRYQMQRHARKLQARVLAPRYRLAPQFPFPCGLMDCLAAYLYLLTVQDPETIVLAGDSAGGGMVLSMLVLLRDQGLPMPAGAILLSPWVDLTHSFPSVAEHNTLDYVPTDGFHHKPSMSWPPPNADELAQLDNVIVEMEHGKRISAKALREQAREHLRKGKGKQPTDSAVGVSSTDGTTQSATATATNGHAHPDVGGNPTVTIDGTPVDVKDQIQFYAPNDLLAHPLVSPIMQSTLGGLPPLCVLVGGGEMLRDEQVYLAHKAADPAAYPPPVREDFPRGSYHHSVLADRAHVNAAIARYPATNVQLQVWDDLCHVAPTLSWTRPAKYMYRSVAQFGAWALARAQMSEIRILDDDEVSIISTESSGSADSDDPAATSSKDHDSEQSKRRSRRNSWLGRKSVSRERDARRMDTGLHRPTTPATIGRAGDPLPLFKDHMIRQRVTRHGDIYSLDPASTLAACTVDATEIGRIKPTPVKKWLHVQKMQASRFGEVKREVQSKRLTQMAETTGGRGMIFTQGREDTMLIGEEHPPPTALAGRSRQHISEMGMLKKKKSRMSRGLAVWSGWGSKHDEEAIDKEEDKVRRKEDVTMSVVNVRKRPPTAHLLGSGPILGGGPLDADRVEPPHPAASTTGGEGSTHTTTAAKKTVPAPQAQTAQGAAPASASDIGSAGNATLAGAADGEQASSSPVAERTTSHHPILRQPPHSAPVTAPFKLARPETLTTAQASTLTLFDADGVIMPESATLPPANYPHHHQQSVASTSSAEPAATGRLGVPGAADGDASRPSTASRPISPGIESVSESLTEAQPAEAQAVTMTHARASSKGDVVEANGGAMHASAVDSAQDGSMDERDATPRGEGRGMGGHGREEGEEGEAGKAAARPGVERFVTAEQLELRP